MNTTLILLTNALFTLALVMVAFGLGLWQVRNWIAAAETRTSVELVKQVRQETQETEWMRDELTAIDQRFVHVEETLKLFEERQKRMARRDRGPTS